MFEGFCRFMGQKLSITYCVGDEMNRKSVIRKQILDLTEDKDWMKKPAIIRQVNSLSQLLILDDSSRKREK